MTPKQVLIFSFPLFPARHSAFHEQSRSPSERASDLRLFLSAASRSKSGRWKIVHAIATFNRRDFSPAIDKFGIEVLSLGAAVELLGGA